ncbi:MAG TPA: hypothetical protein PKC12_04305 [Thiobacillaceae bacterium]|nr:hypothetical protein [Thiobacillaceae bacterium]
MTSTLRSRAAGLSAALVLSAVAGAASAGTDPGERYLLAQQSIDDLFGGPPAPPPAAPEAPATPAPAAVPAIPTPTADTDALPSLVGSTAEASDPGRPTLSGFYGNDLAYTYAGDAHWSRFNNTLDIAGQGRTAGGIGWKLGGRAYYDPIYDLTDHYPAAVRDDQRFEAMIREAYLDIGAGDWEFRLGRQHIIWGEMVGLFFADVVSAKDMRQLVLPDFDMIRIPQWAARAEYFAGDFHAEAVWIPYMTYDDIGKPGAEFYPFMPPPVPGFQTIIAQEKQPVGLDESAYGLRLSWLRNGWDVAGFYYDTNDPAPAFAREITPTAIFYRPFHDRIRQFGATLGKDLGPMVLKAEAVYTRDKLFYTADPRDADALVRQDLLDYVIGLEWSFPEETRFNVQFFQRWFPDHDAGMVQDATESGVSFLFSTQALHPRLEPEIFLIHSLNRTDWLAQFKLNWKPDGNWRLAAGVDILDGPADGLFGPYADRDRVYTEVRYNF